MEVVVFAQTLYKALRQRQEDIREALAADAPRDWESYKKMVGELRGLAFAEDHVRALLENREDDDNQSLPS
jgi:hypothetical protein